MPRVGVPRPLHARAVPARALTLGALLALGALSWWLVSGRAPAGSGGLLPTQGASETSDAAPDTILVAPEADDAAAAGATAPRKVAANAELRGFPFGRVVSDLSGEPLDEVLVTLARGGDEVVILTKEKGEFRDGGQRLRALDRGPLLVQIRDPFLGASGNYAQRVEFDPALEQGLTLRARVGPGFDIAPRWPADAPDELRRQVDLRLSLEPVAIDRSADGDGFDPVPWPSLAPGEERFLATPGSNPASATNPLGRFETTARFRDGVWRGRFPDLFPWARRRSDVPRGRWRLIVKHETNNLIGEVLVDDVVGHSREPLPVTLQKAAALTVIVSNEAGKTIPADVVLERVGSQPKPLRTTAGTHDWSRLVPGTYAVRASSFGRDAREVTVILAPGEERRALLPLPLLPGATLLEGRLILASGSVPESAHALLSPLGQRRAFRRSAEVKWSGKEGRFLFERVPAGDYEITLAGTGALEFEPAVSRVTLPGEVPVFRCDDVANTELYLRVVDEHGLPVQDFRAGVLCTIGFGQRSYTCRPGGKRPVAVIGAGETVSIDVTTSTHEGACTLDAFGPVEVIDGTQRRTANLQLVPKRLAEPRPNLSSRADRLGG